jgi:hypothetical protein
MATYKVLQDIEAEDKLLGPLTLRQFIYAGICVIALYLSFFVITKGLGFMAVLFVPPAILFGFLAFPWSKDQPTEIWALARIRFLVKPRKRIWNQSGVKELVTITAPKHLEQRAYTNGLSQVEVKSRLKALADTIDSRGWAIKNAGDAYAQGLIGADRTSDRLVAVSALPQQVPTLSVLPSDDMLDVDNNRVAQNFDSMITASEKAHRQQIIERMNAATPNTGQPAAAQPSQNNYWFMQQPAQIPSDIPQDAVTFNTQVIAPGTAPVAMPIGAATPTADEEAFIKNLASQPVLSKNPGHLHVIQPLSSQQNPPATPAASTTDDTMASASYAYDTPVTQSPAPSVQQQMTPAPDTAILDLARNDDLNVATIAREAQKRKGLSDGEEVIISLH